MREEYNVSREVTGINVFNLFMMPILREMVLQMLSMWLFQESLLSTWTPRNLIDETLSSWIFSIQISRGKESIVLLNNMYLVFWRLIDNLLARIQLKIFVNSQFIISARVSGSLWEKNRFVSSAKIMKDKIVDALLKSFIYKIKRSGPRILPSFLSILNVTILFHL